MKIKTQYYKIAGFAMLVVMLVAAILVLAPWPTHGGTAEFRIEKGQPLGKTARLLAEQNLINSRFVFVGYAVLTGQERKFKAGKYLIRKPSNTVSLVNMFSRGLSETEDISIIIPEGMNLADIDAAFSKTGLIQKGSLLGPEFLKREGYLFPDTYRFSKEDSGGNKIQAADIIRKMEENFNRKAVDLLKNLSASQIQESVIIASLLEKEVKTPSDMRLVAGIIKKRMSKGMPLEIDATIAYGVCYPKFLAGQYCDTSLANIVDNLKSNSPYNTYQKIDLPPAPISNPGLTAIQATLNPQSSGYLYYLTTKDGTTIFSKTAAEHEAARQKY